MRRNISGARFPLGEVVVTSGALGRLTQADIAAGVERHARCDWGLADGQANEKEFMRGGPLASIHLGANDVKFYVITKAGRSVTTVLLPGEY
jgi:hypothetical protein